MALQPSTVSLATSKLYTRAVLPPAILPCSSSGTQARISIHYEVPRDWICDLEAKFTIVGAASRSFIARLRSDRGA